MKQGAIGRPLAVLTLCVVIVGGGLAWFTARAAMQERTIAEQEAREATARAARLVADAIVPELEALERRVPETDGGGGRQAAQPESGDDRVILTVRNGRAMPTLPMRLLYDLQGPAAGDEIAWSVLGGEPGWPASGDKPTWSAALAAAEALELRARNLPGAIAAYRDLLARAPADQGAAVDRRAPTDPRVRLAVLQRLARSLRNAGRADEALDVLQQLIDEHPSDRSPIVAAAWHDRCALLRAGNLPRGNLPRSSFRAQNNSGSIFRGGDSSVAGNTPADACVVAFYAGLADGRWALEAPLYQFYADAARGWIAPLASRADVTRLIAQERALAGLTQAAGRALRAWQAAGSRDAAAPLMPRAYATLPERPGRQATRCSPTGRRCR